MTLGGDLVTPRSDLMTLRGDNVTSHADLMTLRGDNVTPRRDLVTPRRQPARPAFGPQRVSTTSSITAATAYSSTATMVITATMAHSSA